MKALGKTVWTVLSVVGLLVGACSSSDGGSETNWTACDADTPCRSGFECQDGRCILIEDPTVVTPGVCIGEETVCAAPPARPFEPGPVQSCEVTERGEATVIWRGDLGEVACPVGRCAAVGVDLALGQDGSVWVQSQLRAPGPRIIDAAGTGIGLSRFDASGQRAFTIVVDFPTPLAGDRPATRGMRVDSRGHLLMLAPIQGRPGLELRDYDSSGELVAARPLVDWAVSGTAGIDPDGSLTLLYDYVDTASLDAGVISKDPGRAPRSADLVRLAADGRVVWAQTVSRALWGAATHLASSAAAIGASATFLEAGIGADVSPQRGLLAAIDLRGNVAWVREEEDMLLSGVVPLPDGGVMVTYRRTSSATSVAFLVRVDPDGSSRWRMDVSELTSGLNVSLSGADLEGRVWGLLSSFGREGVWAVSPDGRTCATWSFLGDFCELVENGETWCWSPVLQPAEDGEGYITGGRYVDRVRFGGAP